MTDKKAEPVELSDIQIDRLLSTSIPGGSCARDWFLPHETSQGLINVRDVVRRMVMAAAPNIANDLDQAQKRIAVLKADNVAKDKQIASLQSSIDKLMLKYCPDKMAEKQMERWARHQVPVSKENDK